MSEGVTIVAFNSKDQIGRTLDYVGLAKLNAELIRNFNDLPVCLISDEESDGFEECVIVERPEPSSKRVVGSGELSGTIEYNWFNNTKFLAWENSPWQKTMLVDADYIVNDRYLVNELQMLDGMKICRRVFDPIGNGTFDDQVYLPNQSIKQVWATLMAWDRESSYAQLAFEHAREVAENYEFFAGMFGFPTKPFRNDFVFSITSHVMDIPDFETAMWMVSSKYPLVSVRNGSMYFGTDNGIIAFPDRDVHMLDKSILYEGTLPREHIIDLANQWN